MDLVPFLRPRHRSCSSALPWLELLGGIVCAALPLAAGAPPPGGGVEWQAWLRPEPVEVPGVDERGAEVAVVAPADVWQEVTRFESARDWADHFVARMRGELRAPASGDYRFRLEVRGEAELRVSAVDGDGAKTIVMRARDETTWSDPVALVAGRGYCVEAWHRGGAGPDALRVGWRGPDGREEEVIDGQHFGPVPNAEAREVFNYRRARLEPFTRSYDFTTHLSRDRHRPRADEHLTRETVYAAAAMLGSDDPELWAEAARALARVLPYQNTDDSAWIFGNWPRVVEQPENFDAQNIGGFIGGELILILQRYRDRLPPDLVGKVEEALRRAADRGRRYNPPVTASNIVTKAVAVGLLADEMVGAPAAGAWAAQRLRELHAHTAETGLPTEYNSPTYNGVVLKALALLRTYLRDAALRPLVEDIYEATWRELALNYHPHLQLWTGPAARRYEDVYSPGARLQEATDHELFFGESSVAELPVPMPGRFRHLFERTVAPVERRFTVLTAKPVARLEDQQSPRPLVATIYQAPEFSLGSFNRADLWDQRRPLMAYWGRRDAPGFFRLTSPSGRHGLLAAQTHILQQGGEAVVAVTFITDAGWGRPPYGLVAAERADAPRVSDVRIRLVAGGEAAAEPWRVPGTPRGVIGRALPGGRLEVRLLHGDFGGAEPTWELTEDGQLDLVLHRGDEIDLGRVASAAVVLAVSIGSADEERPEAAATVVGDEVHVTLGDRRLTVPVRPMEYAESQARVTFAEPAPAAATAFEGR